MLLLQNCGVMHENIFIGWAKLFIDVNESITYV